MNYIVGIVYINILKKLPFVLRLLAIREGLLHIVSERVQPRDLG
jgi:hypothetical protein